MIASSLARSLAEPVARSASGDTTPVYIAKRAGLTVPTSGTGWGASNAWNSQTAIAGDFTISFRCHNMSASNGNFAMVGLSNSAALNPTNNFAALPLAVAWNNASQVRHWKTGAFGVVSGVITTGTEIHFVRVGSTITLSVGATTVTTLSLATPVYAAIPYFVGSPIPTYELINMNSLPIDDGVVGSNITITDFVV